MRTALVIGVALILSPLFAVDGMALPAREGPKAAPAAIVPELSLDAASAMDVRFVFENRSDKALMYLPRDDKKGPVAGLNLSVSKDGKRLKLLEYERPPMLSAD